jgi:hypothetical protein
MISSHRSSNIIEKQQSLVVGFGLKFRWAKVVFKFANVRRLPFTSSFSSLA